MVINQQRSFTFLQYCWGLKSIFLVQPAYYVLIIQLFFGTVHLEGHEECRLNDKYYGSQNLLLRSRMSEVDNLYSFFSRFEIKSFKTSFNIVYKSTQPTLSPMTNVTNVGYRSYRVEQETSGKKDLKGSKLSFSKDRVLVIQPLKRIPIWRTTLSTETLNCSY